MGGSSKQTTNVPAPSAQELELLGTQSDLAKAQLDAIRQQSDYQAKEYAATGPLLDQQSKLIQAELARISSPEYAATQAKQDQLTSLQLDSAIRNQPAQDELLQIQLDAARRGGAATPEQLDLIGQATDAAITAGTSDINKFAGDAMKNLRLQLAPSLGLRPTDTPILDRGNLVGSEATRQVGQLTTNLRGAQAQAALNFPLAAQNVQNATVMGQQGVLSAADQFQQQLVQAANANRLALFGSSGNFSANTANTGLGLAGIGINSGTLSSLAGARVAGATRTTDTSPGLFDWFKAAGQVAGAAGGGISSVRSVFG